MRDNAVFPAQYAGSNLKITFQHNVAASALSPGVAGGTWIAPEVTMLPLAARECVLRNPFTGASVRATPEGHGLLQHCTTFRSLHAHADHICAVIPSLGGHRAWVLQQLGAFAQAGVMISAAQAVASWKPAEDAGRSAGVFGVVIRTCERPHLLQRLLASLQANQHRHQQTLAYHVLDDTRSADLRKENAKVCAAATDLNVIHHALDEDFALDAALKSRFPDAISEVEWLLGRTTSGSRGETYGRPVNWALLRSAGQRLLSIDDDVVLDARRSPSFDGAVGISGNRDRWYFYGSKDEILEHCERLDIDPLAEHLQVLGRPLATILARHLGNADALCRDLTADDLARLDASSMVLLTQNSVLGDPGSSLNPHPLYSTFGEDFARFTESEASYAAYRRLRYNWRGQPGLRIATRRPLTFSTVAGIDNTILLPPTVPTFRNEDLLLGEVTQFLYPHAVLLDLPWSLLHFRDPEKEWTPLGDAGAFRQDVLHVLLDVVAEAGEQCRAEAPDDRMRYLAAVMEDLGGASERKLVAYLDHHLLDSRTRIGYELRQALDEHPDAPDYWKRDVQAYLSGPNMRMSTSDVAAARAEAALVRRTLRSYARALTVWPSLWKACSEQ
jgi:hypothetical protein